MSLCENFSELARELRTAAGTVLSIVGSRLEATERARVDEVGPQWLTEFEEQRDHLEPGECTCVPCPLRDEDVCDEAEADEDYLFTTTWADYNAKKPEFDDGDDPVSPCGCQTYRRAGKRHYGYMCDEHIYRCKRCDRPTFPIMEYDTACCSSCTPPDSSAADTAADPSPATTTGCSRAGDEGPEGASAIPPAAPSGQPTPCAACDYTDNGWCPCKCHRQSDPGAVTSPAPGGQVLEDDLAAHIMGDFVSGQEVDPLTAPLIDALSSRIASALLTDFTITRRA